MIHKCFLLRTLFLYFYMKHIYIISFVCICLNLFNLNAQPSIEETRALLDEWVETQQIISEEQQDWRIEKSILAETRTLLSNEFERLQDSIKDLEDSATQADQERSSLTEEKDDLKAAADVIAAQITELENKTRKILPMLPKPLIDRINPLIRRLPEDSENAKLSLGERVQNIVGILSQADKFNNTITPTSETRKVNGGKEVQVNTLYWGLAIAYFVDASGDYAGIAYPTKNGWKTSLIEGIGPQIQQLVSVYEGDGEIQFVEVPAQIH